MKRKKTATRIAKESHNAMCTADKSKLYVVPRIAIIAYKISAQMLNLSVFDFFLITKLY